MQDLTIPATNKAPQVEMRADGTVSITGQSFVEDASIDFRPVVDWVSEYVKTQSAALRIDFYLTYFNSTTAKQLLKILMLIDSSESNGTVTWFYPDDNQLLRDRGREMEVLVDVPFTFKSRPLH